MVLSARASLPVIVVCLATLTWLGSADAGRMLAAAVVVYGAGYVTGALLVSPSEDRRSLSVAVVRLVSGLLLTTIAFLASLVFALPWFAGPILLLVLALAVHRRACLPLPDATENWDTSKILALIVSAVLVAPIVITSLRMAPGSFPPVFFNVDTPYFLEKVHTLVTTESYPPNSLSFVDGRRPYHFGVHGMAAFIARASGLAPHHTLFLVVLPLLAVAVVAAAFVLARRVSAGLPLWTTAPLLLVSVPTLWYPFWNTVTPLVREAISSASLDPLLRLSASVELWGVASNNGQNIASHFIVLGGLAGIAGARTSGWRLPVFLLGSAVIFKAPTGVALVSGFTVAQALRVVTTKSIRPIVPAAAMAAVFGVVYGMFWLVAPTPPESMTELFPFFHLTFVREHGGLASFTADVLWLVLPLLVVLPRVLRGSAREGLPLLALVVAPFVVVNSLRLIDLRPGFGIDDDWLQVMLPVPIVLHVFVLTVLGGRWPELGAAGRTAVLIAMLLLVLPPAAVAARYSVVLFTHPERGHEFVDNRPLGAALAAIPVQNSVIVTNDLRYPAEGFSRGNRQMQIPALFGHQAFAVNYAYEAYAFSRDRVQLQKLLQSPEWSDTIGEAARANHWTHLLIRRDFVHPAPIPLQQVFENDLYVVYRFPES